MSRQLRLGTLAVLAALAAAVPSVMIGIHVQAVYAVVAGASIASVTAVFAGYWRDSLLETFKQDRSVKLAVRNGCLTAGDGFALPRIRQIKDPTALGVHPAISSSTADGGQGPQPVYVGRDVDSDLRDLLYRPAFVVVKGDSKAGKTRTAFEAMAAMLPEHELLAVQDRKILEQALQRMEQGNHIVLFLDDLEKYLDEGVLLAPRVDRLFKDEEKSRFIVATIRSQQLAAYEDTEPASRPAASDALAVLAKAQQIQLDRLFTRQEQERAKVQARSDQRIARAVKSADRFGIAEYLAAAPELMRRWTNARDGGDHVAGAALVSAAVECRRAGLIGPLPRKLLESLCGSFIRSRGGTSANCEALDKAWQWATAAVSTTALLTVCDSTPDSPVDVFDYLVDEASRTAGGPVPDVVLRACLKTTDTTVLMRVGATARLQARYEIALDAFREAWRLLADEQGQDSEASLAAHGHHAAMLRALGDFQNAEAEHRAVLEARLRTLGADHPGTLASRNNLALVLHDLGRFDEAEAEHRAVHNARARKLGSDSPATLTNRNNLAMVLHDLGRFDDAEREHCAVLIAYDRLLRDVVEHRSAEKSTNTAAVLASLGRLEDAEAEHRTVLDTSTRVYGRDHPDALTSKGSPTLVLHAPERLEEAERLHEHVEWGLRMVLGELHPTALTALSNLAVVRHALGKYELAEQGHQATAVGFARVLGEDHPSTLTCLSNHAVALQALNRIDEAEAEHRLVIERVTRTLGARHPSTLTARNYLASLLYTLGRLEEAEAEQEDVLRGFIDTFGDDHPSTLTSQGNLAVTYAAQKRFPEALEKQTQVLAKCEQLRGADHPATLTSRANRAVVLIEVGQRAEALAEGEAVYQGFNRVLGSEHPRTMMALQLLETIRGTS
ncbi:MAG: tetratricopeptide repeat protein [Catenulispora sp.]|nr:tetratricopeptide repeat protein [Catenulispora sp.]